MDYLQYTVKNGESRDKTLLGFKPYYKWITFNTFIFFFIIRENISSFKPYYKWITFNTAIE